MFISTYKGFSIAESTRHGKAVKGNKKMTTIQVRDHSGCEDGYFLIKQIKYPYGDLLKRTKAIEDAKKFIDELLTEIVLKKDESKQP